MIEMIGIGSVTALVSFLSISRLRGWIECRGVYDIPNERSSHTRPTPRGGGLVIVVLTTLGLAVAWFQYPAGPPTALAAYLAGAWLIAGVSWLDDLRSLSNRVRFGTHMLAALLAVWAFGYWTEITVPIIGLLRLGLLGLPITFLWIVGATNAYNFMDGIDGIAGGQAVVAGLGWAVLGWLTAQPLVGMLGVLLAAASLGFLGHNWPPARIFMGDVGSAFLGFTFAVLAVAAAQRDARLALVGILFVWPFVFDATFTFLRRLKNGENIFAAHRSHLYQRLVIVGYSHRIVTLLYIGLAAWGTIWGSIWSRNIAGSETVVVVTIPLLCLGLWAFVSRQEHTHNSRPKNLRDLTS
jgi:UDP-N-acetylmuramyl pentapeptide phosphotransferase/UDP-N-acetylglucosamine-1-phosphate transferase